MGTKNHTDVVKDTVEQLHTRILSILDQQQFTITREAVHRETAERTNTRVVWWTVVEVITLICLAGFQVYYLRSYFGVKTIILNLSVSRDGQPIARRLHRASSPMHLLY